jgi:hypothetical protein
MSANFKLSHYPIMRILDEDARIYYNLCSRRNIGAWHVSILYMLSHLTHNELGLTEPT